jgi:hypothetical protein
MEKPYRVPHDVLEESRECFSVQILPVFPDVLVKVCVELVSESEGVVVSAFLTAGIRAEEMRRWS